MITILLTVFYIYLAAGLVFGLWFVFKGVRRIDENMKDTGFGMRVLLLPGSAALWPVLLRKILQLAGHLRN